MANKYSKSFPVVKLANGIDMPSIGFGCAELPPSTIEAAVHAGLEAGYRFFDNAPFYRDEAEIGAALKSSGINREDLFVSTKLPNESHDYEAALKRFDLSLKTMGLDYLDMYMIHFPCPQQGKFTEAWKALEKLHKDGLVRSIGVSNFTEGHLQKIFDKCEVRPVVNEIECNPYFAQPALRKFCMDNDIHPIAWFPLGGPIAAIEEPLPGTFADGDPIAEILAVIRTHNVGKKVLLKDQTAKAIGDKYGKTIAQVALRWHLQSNIIPIPKGGLNRLHENCNIFDFSLTPEEMKQMDALDHGRRLGPDPETSPMHNCT